MLTIWENHFHDLHTLLITGSSSNTNSCVLFHMLKTSSSETSSSGSVRCGDECGQSQEVEGCGRSVVRLFAAAKVNQILICAAAVRRAKRIGIVRAHAQSMPDEWFVSYQH